MTGHRKRDTEYLIRILDDPSAVDPVRWNGLLAAQARPTPFLRHEYLDALHRSGSAVPETGWSPRFFVVEQGGEMVAACAAYLKTHSYGEYVFDWAWADAYQRHGLRYFPKLLSAVPFTPVPGTRLLARDADARAVLIQAIGQWAREEQLSSAHLLFMDDIDRAALEAAGWMIREGVQFHWTADPLRPAATFDDLLAALHREKRKKILQERRKVAEAGVSFTVHRGAQIDAALWDFFYRCYTATYRAHHSTPYLTRDFFADMACRMPAHWLLFVAHRAGRPVASSLIAVDDGSRTAWGRYWGALEGIPCLHFEACYYQPLAWCIEAGYERFEGGAQGEHKMARGLLPVRTSSAHWLRDGRFASAVADFLDREGQGVAMYIDELRDRSPYRVGTAGAAAGSGLHTGAAAGSAMDTGDPGAAARAQD